MEKDEVIGSPTLSRNNLFTWKFMFLGEINVKVQTNYFCPSNEDFLSWKLTYKGKDLFI